MFKTHKLKTLHSLFIACGAVSLSLSASATNEGTDSYQKLGYFQSPSIHVDTGHSDAATTLVFAAEGDLWRMTPGAFAGANSALRMTTH